VSDEGRMRIGVIGYISRMKRTNEHKQYRKLCINNLHRNTMTRFRSSWKDTYSNGLRTKYVKKKSGCKE
jgi:hypothetical protein